MLLPLQSAGPAGITISDLAAACGMSVSWTAMTLGRLEARELVVRRVDRTAPSRDRVLRLAVTPGKEDAFVIALAQANGGFPVAAPGIGAVEVGRMENNR